MDMKEALKRASTVTDIKPTEITQVAIVMMFIDKTLKEMCSKRKVKLWPEVDVFEIIAIIQNDPSFGKFHEIVKTWNDRRMISVASRLEEKYRRRDYTLLVQLILLALMILGIVLIVHFNL